MLFSSIVFLYYFLPVILLLYFIVPKCLKNAVLLTGSLFFYAWGEPKIVLVMMASILVGYISGLLIEAFRAKKAGKIILIFSVVVQLGCLVYFKYMDFFIENINLIFDAGIPLLSIALPIGISFYTFQILSYTIDIYRGEKAQKNPLDMAMYIAMFPQLIAGPIVRYKDIAPQLKAKERKITQDDVAYGIRRFVLGLGKKILIANQLGELCDIFRASNEKSVLFYWMYAVGAALHIYFDFSGYSDMAIGLGKILGFSFTENFRYPFVAGSITEFWRRWHISLGSWFRDYVYIPLGGNRVPAMRWFFNIVIVWLLTGFWHGASWNFVLWGLFFAVLLIVEKSGLLRITEKHKMFGHVYVILAVLVSFVLFNATDLKDAGNVLGGMLGLGGTPLISGETLYYVKNYFVVLVIAVAGATPLMKKLFLKLSKQPVAEMILVVAEPLFYVLLMLVMTAYLVDGSFNPFLYFRF